MLEGKSILIVKYSSLGDVINGVPAVRFLRKNCPDAKIRWVIKKEYSPLFRDCGFIDEIVEYRGNSLSEISGFLKRLRSVKTDIAIDLQGLLKSSVIAYLSGAVERVCYPGSREMSGIFYTKKLGKARRTSHAVVENVSVVEGLLNNKASGDYDTAIDLSDETVCEAMGLIKVTPFYKGGLGGIKGFAKEGRLLVVVSPTSRWRSKMWPADRFAALSDKLHDAGADIVFTGAAGDIVYVEGIRAIMKNASLNLAGKTDIRTLAGIIKIAGLVVSCDSGAMHLSSAMDTPVVAIFGPTDPSYTGPFNKKSLVISAGAECSPCRERDCDAAECMGKITVEEAFEKIYGFLKAMGIK
ncbi:MAG: glycosyltransferase family 9 protein [Deltaproteobacteria bacterium]